MTLFDKALSLTIASVLSASLTLAAQTPAVTPAQAPVASPPLSVNIDLPPLSDDYALGPDSLRQPGVPAGKIFKFHITDSKIFPGTDRTITVYIPAAYTGDKPACLFVFFGGVGPSDTAPIVFDNLIAQHAMPITIAVGISPGRVASNTAEENPRFERSMELDSMTDRMPRFVLEEVLPEVERQKTPDGKPILLSKDPNDRAVGGSSTGGIGAFNLAWQRPDSFHRVFTSIGTFVDMRGGERFYSLVRKTEPKPLRIFMEDGLNDQCTPVTEMGDWSMSNQTMERALEFNGYDVTHSWGVGGHSNKHAAAIFPYAMRWLWNGWPAAVQQQPKASTNPALKALLQPNEAWQVAVDHAASANHVVADLKGEVYYQDEGKTLQILEAGETAGSAHPNAILAVGPDGKTYGPEAAAGLSVRGMTVRNNGDLYVTAEGPSGQGELWLIHPNGQRARLADNIKGASGVALSPDGLWLAVAQSGSRWALNYRVRADGSVDLPEPFYDFWVSDAADSSGAGDFAMDVHGTLFAASPMGVQVFDRNGRVMAILPLPNNEPATGVCFGGPAFDTLYVTSNDRVYKRKLRTPGFQPWAQPIKLPHWGEG